MDDVFVLLGREDRELAGRAEHAIDHFVRELIELLDLFAMNVLAARVAKDVDEARANDLAVDHLRRERDVVEDARELAAGLGMLALLLEDELGERDRAGRHRRQSWRPVTSSGPRPADTASFAVGTSRARLPARLGDPQVRARAAASRNRNFSSSDGPSPHASRRADPIAAV